MDLAAQHYGLAHSSSDAHVHYPVLGVFEEFLTIYFPHKEHEWISSPGVWTTPRYCAPETSILLVGAGGERVSRSWARRRDGILRSGAGACAVLHPTSSCTEVRAFLRRLFKPSCIRIRYSRFPTFRAAYMSLIQCYSITSCRRGS